MVCMSIMSALIVNQQKTCNFWIRQENRPPKICCNILAFQAILGILHPFLVCLKKWGVKKMAKSNTRDVILKVTRGGREFRFTKMWCYIIKIPGDQKKFPLPYYYYIGITTRTDPTERIYEHYHEIKKNQKFEEIRKNVPYDAWEVIYLDVPIIGDDGEQNLDRLKQLEVEMISLYDTFLTKHGLNKTPGGEDPFDGPKGQPPEKTLGAYHVIIRKRQSPNRQFEFTYQRYNTHTPYFSVNASKPSDFLQRMIDNPNVNIHQVFYDFQYFMYCAVGAINGYYDFDQKTIQKDADFRNFFDNSCLFTLDRIDDAIRFLKVLEDQLVIQKGQKVLIPKDLNT